MGFGVYFKHHLISGVFRLAVGKGEVTFPNLDWNSFKHTKKLFRAETGKKEIKLGTLNFHAVEDCFD